MKLALKKIKKHNKEFCPVAVFWRDAVCFAGWRGTPEQDMEDRCVSVGTHIRTTKDYVLIALSDGVSGDHGDHMQIPLSCVMEIMPLTQYKPRKK